MTDMAMGDPKTWEDIHVYPLGDLREHIINCRACPCKPLIERFSWGQAVLIHNAWDGRNVRERGVDYAGEARIQ